MVLFYQAFSASLIKRFALRVCSFPHFYTCQTDYTKAMYDPWIKYKPKKPPKYFSVLGAVLSGDPAKT